ncbi:hypothetical protein [Streptomyces sp. CT34]|uniref:hypothetical protein n=1 Tax=Streptomyces sp. CT34 TaxID=1553907 RepID=UPI0005BC497A|nr:hypothetical protein [Streptomyces sp. CT34]
MLQQDYRNRPFVNEELWAGKLARALRAQPSLAEATGLNYIRIEQSPSWEAERFVEEEAARDDRDG